MKVVIMNVDPWRQINLREPFDLPENIFTVEGNVAQPPKTSRNLEFSYDKIRNIQILQKKVCFIKWSN